LKLKFALKKHPTLEKESSDAASVHYKVFDSCEELPAYIPAELFYNNIRKNVLTLFSASIITASQFEHIKAISLLELIHWHHESYKKEFKNYLMKESKNKVIFPNSFEELKEILLNE